MFILKILRIIFITLDNVVYQCIDLFYQLFIMLAETGIFSGKAIQEFAGRIYFFLGLIMVFKVSISIIQYIMNPDMVKDSKMGAPKLLSNIVIILLGIVFIPYIFEAAFSLQRLILKDNVIGNLILGQTYQEGKSTDFIKNAGDRMAFSSFTAFFRFNDEIVGGECSNSPYDQDGNISTSCTEDPNYSYIEPFLSSHGDDYSKAYKDMNMHILATDMDIYNYTVEVPNEQGKMKDKFLFSYMLLITTGAGGFIAYILLTFCFDVAVRSVKLGFLQLIAPIPLISKIDPKKGDEVFNKWVKECTSTYLSLFIRLVAIYFGLYIISLIGDGMFNVVTGEKERNVFVFVFIILGTLLFVKELPKLLENITGMKIDSKGGLNLAKKFGDVPLVGNAAGNLARRTIGGIDAKRNGHNFKDGWRKAAKNDKGFFADLRKKKDAMMPYTAKAREEKQQGLEEKSKIDSRWKKGQNARLALRRQGTSLKNAFDVLNGEESNRNFYEAVYNNREFIDSLMKLDRADAEMKKIKQEYDVAYASGKLSPELQKKYEDQVKKVEGLKNVHETMRKVYQDDADTQDSIKFNKNNRENPVNDEVAYHEGVTHKTFSEAVNEAAGVGHRASDHGAPTARNSAFNGPDAEEYFSRHSESTSSSSSTPSDGGSNSSPALERNDGNDGGNNDGNRGGGYHGPITMSEGSIAAIADAMSNSVNKGMETALGGRLFDDAATKIGNVAGDSVRTSMRDVINSDLKPGMDNLSRVIENNTIALRENMPGSKDDSDN